MIAGLQKMTLLDFPGKVACTVFLAGCNYRCPFCHNSELFMGKVPEFMSDAEFFTFLEKRQGLLEGVCVSGGEPTLYPGLENFLTKIKELGFAVKLDTNGSCPEVLKALVKKGLIDYVAVDVKNGPSYYETTVGCDPKLPEVEESFRFLIEGNVAYELRTTLVKQLHNAASIEEMGKWLSSLVPGKKPAQLFLQTFVDRDTVVYEGLCAPEENDVTKYKDILTSYIGKVTIRNQ